jgi:hypothetical protein
MQYLEWLEKEQTMHFELYPVWKMGPYLALNKNSLDCLSDPLN